jgi:ABC-type lipoprotein release transport system permease subunit
VRTRTLILRNLRYYARTNLAVVLGAATGTAVLAGSLVVGDSVRASLRDLVTSRLGRTETVIASSGFFREALAQDFSGACPLIAMESFVTHEATGRRASRVDVYGVDARFLKFHGREGAAEAPGNRDVLLSEALAAELGAKPGDSILLRVPKPSDIPVESLHGRKDDTGRTLRLTARQTLGAGAMGEFSLRPQQAPSRAVFVSLSRLQRDLDRAGRANAILLPQAIPDKTDLARAWKLEDAGIKVRVIGAANALSVEADGALVNDALSASAQAVAAKLGMTATPLFTYLANSVRVEGREVPYSLVTAMPFDAGASPDSMVLNDWAAADLKARVGDRVRIEYYVWTPDGSLATRTADFRLSRIEPMRGVFADRDLAPEYPGITSTRSLHDWDPPFPMDLGRVRPRDEDYWDRFRTTPKAFIPIARGQELWQSRFGKLTSLRVAPRAGMGLEEARAAFARELRDTLDPGRMGLAARAVRAQGIEASEGSTDFGEYFVYFSFFLVMSALLLTGLFFKLGVEQRMREIGTLRAAGFSEAAIRRVFLWEGAALAAAGSVLGVAAAAVYAGLILAGLRTWWVDAVGTRLLTLHLALEPLSYGASGGIAAAFLAIAFTLRGLRGVTPRGLLGGAAGFRAGARRRWLPWLAAAAAGALLYGAATGRIPAAGGFFGAGALLLIATLQAAWLWLTRRGRRVLTSVFALGFRNATSRPGRSVASIAFIASAAFLIVSIESFRRPPRADLAAGGGTGGYPYLAESLLPIIHNPATPEGREALNLTPFAEVKFVPFRLKAGDDASCLNLYAPRNPRVLGAPAAFLQSAGFAFADSLARDKPGSNPWALLEADSTDGAIPAAADANSMAYVLHRKLGDEITVDNGGAPVRLRLVAALDDSVFQGEILIAEKHFTRAFPGEQGYRFFLIDSPRASGDATAGLLEAALADYDLDVQSTSEKLAGFHRVENAYLSTFQSLGGLGLALGTVGLAAVLLRNVIERRKELALLRAAGFGTRDIALAVAAESALLLASGLAAGGICALIAVAPTAAARGSAFSAAGAGWLIAAVFATGMLSSLAATAAAVRTPLLSALRAE